MQNWNDGKRQEFADRKTYKIGELDSKAQKYGEDSHSISGKTYELYTTATCPQCRMIKPVLEAARIPYVLRDVEQYKIEAV